MWSEAPLWVILVYVSTGLWVLWLWATTLFTGIYQYVLYPRRLKRRYDPDYLPRCTVIIPCKGTPPHARSNLLAFLQQDYPRYDVVFVVEAENDPAVPIIRSLVAQDDRASLVIAGLASACAQKVYNLLAGIQRVGSSEVLVFADNDIGPAPDWLRQLVLPLSDPTVSVTTGYCRVRGRNRTLSEFAHSYTRMFMYVLFTWMAYWSGIGLWGGTLAMRKRDFDALQVAARWRESVVDDMSLSQIVMRRGLKSVLVPLCITPSDNVLSTFGSFTDWVARQLLYVKAYHPGVWLVGLVTVFGASLVYVLFPASILGALLTPLSFWEWGGGALLVFVAGDMLTVLFYALLGPVPKLPKLSLLAPVLRFGQIVGYYKTIATRTITWGGVRYTFDGSGKVIRVER
jgi:cellulose synthase/poly-beta-1,6-N-acetylglucosamine synthase-like glycosyltransferase